MEVHGRVGQRQWLVHRILSVQEAMREGAFARIGSRLRGAEATTLAQTRILFLLRAVGPLSVSELAERLGVSRPAVSPVVDQLVRRHFLSRTEHPDDRRITIVDLTDEGRAFVEEALRVRNERLVDALQRLSDDELETVVSAFDILSRAADALKRQEATTQKVIRS